MSTTVDINVTKTEYQVDITANPNVYTVNITTSTGGGVESVAGDLVDNTDPLNPVIETPSLPDVLRVGDRIFQVVSEEGSGEYTFKVDDRVKDTMLDNSVATHILADDGSFPLNSEIHYYCQNAPSDFSTATVVKYNDVEITSLTIEVGDMVVLKKVTADDPPNWVMTITNKGSGGADIEGTANEITVSGTDTKTIGISSTYTSARNSYADGKVQNSMSSSTSIAPSASAVKSEYDMVTGDTFSGAFLLDRKGGRSYLPYTQTGSIVFSISASPITGGFAVLKFTANGSSISGFSGWKLLSADGITQTNGVVHRIVVYQYEDEIWYSVKLN